MAPRSCSTLDVLLSTSGHANELVCKAMRLHSMTFKNNFQIEMQDTGFAEFTHGKKTQWPKTGHHTAVSANFSTERLKTPSRIDPQPQNHRFPARTIGFRNIFSKFWASMGEFSEPRDIGRL
jgi:hypothetical protein